MVQVEMTSLGVLECQLLMPHLMFKRERSIVSKDPSTATTGLNLAHDLAANKDQGIRTIEESLAPYMISIFTSRKHTVQSPPGMGGIDSLVTWNPLDKLTITKYGLIMFTAIVTSEHFKEPAAFNTCKLNLKLRTSYALHWWKMLPTSDLVYSTHHIDNMMIRFQSHFLDEECFSRPVIQLQYKSPLFYHIDFTIGG